MVKTVSIITLGCKVNFTDSMEMAKTLTEQGYSVVYNGTRADISIINTCTVTARADYQSRQAVRRATRAAPDIPVLVTGCAASAFPERIMDAAPEAVIIPIDRRNAIIESVSALIGTPENRVSELSVPTRTRAFLKIQEGCTAGCAYCIVPRARGLERSMPPGEVLDRLTALGQQGYKEVVLVGIHLGRYGNGLPGPPVTLAGLLETIEALHVAIRIRLSSVEPMELTDELLSAVAESSVVARHLHVPLQSGDDSILKSMGRPYRRDDIEAIVGKAATRLADPAIGMDVLVGFPGEEEQEFSNTIELISRLPVSYLHVFPFSKRPHTRAYTMNGQVNSFVKTARARIARELGAQKKEAYIFRNLGRPVTVLVESHDAGIVRGKSGNYLDVYFPGGPEDLNSFVPVVLERPFREGVYGRRSS